MINQRPPPTAFDEYRLLWSIGRGGMGDVFLGHDVLLDRKVAIKFLRPAPDDDLDQRELSLAEARAAAQLQGPNVVAVYRVGEVDGLAYIVSEYVAGRSLDLLPRPLPWQRVLELGLGLSKGLATAHERGVLHRDIKLSNAILAEDGTVKLLDFGLAKLMGAPDAAAGLALKQSTPGSTSAATTDEYPPLPIRQVTGSDEVKKGTGAGVVSIREQALLGPAGVGRPGAEARGPSGIRGTVKIIRASRRCGPLCRGRKARLARSHGHPLPFPPGMRHGG